MRQLKQDMTRVQMLVGDALVQTGGLMAVADGVPLSAPKFQKSLERTMDLFEQSTLELRQLCERHMPGLGYYGSRSQLLAVSVTGSGDPLHGWLPIRLNTLLPHCRYQPPAWLSDTIRRLLDDYEQSGGVLPHLEQALLVIDEHSAVEGRHIFDQDNKGWKAVSNALKGRLIPDDDQYTLGVALLSRRCQANVCHIFLLDPKDSGEFFIGYFGHGAETYFYHDHWTADAQQNHTHF